MSVIDARLLEILACPEDKGPLLLIGDDTLYNQRLRRAYRIDDGIPVLLVDESREIDEAEHADMLTRASTGLCGPGGADYVEATASSANRLFLHGWVCDGVNSPCPPSYDQRQDPTFDGKRVLYVAQLRWSGAPRGQCRVVHPGRCGSRAWVGSFSS